MPTVNSWAVAASFHGENGNCRRECQLTDEGNDVDCAVQVVALVDTRVTVDTDGPIACSEALKLQLMHAVFSPR